MKPLTTLLKAIRSESLQKTFKLIQCEGNACILRYLTNVDTGISPVYEMEIYIVRSSEKVYRIATKTVYLYNRHETGQYECNPPFRSIQAVIDFLNECRRRVGTDLNGKYKY